MDARALIATGILGVVLAGGQSRRFGRDKAAAQLGGRRLIELVSARAGPQTDALAISGRNYGLGLPVIPDITVSEGPLTGVLSALQWAGDAGFSAMVTFSCDAPFFPLDMVRRLKRDFPPGRNCAYASAQGTRHPAFALWRTGALGPLREIYAAGTRSLMAAQDQLGSVAVDFATGEGPGGDMFFNINQPGDQSAAQVWLRRRAR